MKKLLYALLLFFGCNSAPTPTDRDSLRAALGSIEGGDDSLTALEGDVSAGLLALASDLGEPRFFRRRAILAMRRYPTPEIYAFLSSMARGTAREDPFLGPPTFSALSAFAAVRPEEVTTALSQALDAEAPAVRLRAAMTLGALSGAEAETARMAASKKALDPELRLALGLRD